jgi:hypothetical protein
VLKKLRHDGEVGGRDIGAFMQIGKDIPLMVQFNATFTYTSFI